MQNQALFTQAWLMIFIGVVTGWFSIVPWQGAGDRDHISASCSLQKGAYQVAHVTLTEEICIGDTQLAFIALPMVP